MSAKIAYEKDTEKRKVEKSRDVKYDCHGKDQYYSNREMDKHVDKRSCVKYKADDQGGMRKMPSNCGRSEYSSVSKRSSYKANSLTSKSTSNCRKIETSDGKRMKKLSSSKSASDYRKTGTCDGKRMKKLSPTEVAAKCYEVKREKKTVPCREMQWQFGKYVQDECGSGIVPRRHNFTPNRKLWCQTPLSMYQATIGELGRMMLCGEKVIERDVRPEPPCNISETILPPCRGYYRKYDCLRPCEEDYSYYKNGKKYYRDRIERYWEPCLTTEQKYKLNINEYGPHNSALILKLKKQVDSVPCW